LVSYTDKYLFEKVKLTGTVFNIKADFFQINVRIPGGSQWDTEAVVITYYGITTLPSGIYKDTTVVVYGTVMGRMEGTNAFGATISQLHVDAEIIEKR